MRIVIGGEDEIAFRLAEVLMADHALTLVCREGLTATKLQRLDVEVIPGPQTSSQVLRQAGIADADLFISCSPSDESNLVACVTAKRLGARRTVCFMFRLDQQATAEERRTLAESLGIDVVVHPGEQLARAIVRIVLVPGALDVEVFAGGRVQLLQYSIEAGARITQQPLAEMGVPEGVVLVMARRGERMFIPRGDTRFEVGDKVTAMGSLPGVNRLLYGYLRGPRHAADVRRATIVGGGAVGLAVARHLEDANWEIKVIEQRRARCDEISPVLRGLVFEGDGADLDLLESERVGEDPVLVAVTSNDEKNLLVSLLARHLGVPRILTRVDQHVNERLFEKVGVDVVLSGRAAAIQSVVSSIEQARADLLAEVEHGDAEVLELEVPEDVSPTPLRSLKSDLFAIIGAILRGGRVIIPRGSDHVQAGDRLLVFCKRENEEAVRRFFEFAGE
jgi:trk system potassium uptake protein TrkA